MMERLVELVGLTNDQVMALTDNGVTTFEDLRALAFSYDVIHHVLLPNATVVTKSNLQNVALFLAKGRIIEPETTMAGIMRTLARNHVSSHGSSSSSSGGSSINSIMPFELAQEEEEEAALNQEPPAAPQPSNAHMYLVDADNNGQKDHGDDVGANHLAEVTNSPPLPIYDTEDLEVAAIELSHYASNSMSHFPSPTPPQPSYHDGGPNMQHEDQEQPKVQDIPRSGWSWEQIVIVVVVVIVIVVVMVVIS